LSGGGGKIEARPLARPFPINLNFQATIIASISGSVTEVGKKCASMLKKITASTI
jgi:hypothetical protein